MMCRHYGSGPGITRCTSTCHLHQGCTHDSRSHCTHHAPVCLLWKGDGRGSTVHSIGQLSHFGLDIDDQSSAIPGHKQCMVTPDWWIIPFNIFNGLTRIYRILGLTTFNSLLQYVNWLVWEVCSVN